MKKFLQSNYTFAVILFLLITISGKTQVITTNRNAVGMEHNMLFNAVTRYKVTQSGEAKFDLNMLFDGAFFPSYTNAAVNPSNPTVITIEGLPVYHVQTGAWVGWSTRYLPARRFKIEAYNTWSGNSTGWVTVADYSNTDFGGNDFTVQLPQIQPSSLRFTFYQSGDSGGRLGLSELFYLQPEGTRPYEGLLKYDEGTTGTMSVGSNNNNMNGYGSKLLFLGASENSDPLWIARYNIGYNNSELRVNISDDPTQAEDKFAVGVTGGDNVWHPILTVKNDHNIIADGKITATEVQVIQNVWSDFVFKPTYKLMPLCEVEKFVKTNSHLPEIPSAAEVSKNGLNMGEMQNKLLQKVEELTLYAIEQEKSKKKLEDKLAKQDSKYNLLLEKLEIITKQLEKR